MHLAEGVEGVGDVDPVAAPPPPRVHHRPQPPGHGRVGALVPRLGLEDAKALPRPHASRKDRIGAWKSNAGRREAN